MADDDDPLRRNAALPRVEQAAEERRVDRRLERRVGQHDEGIAASQFHDRFLEIAARAFGDRRARALASGNGDPDDARVGRSEERRYGEGWCSTCRSRGSAYHYKTKK